MREFFLLTSLSLIHIYFRQAEEEYEAAKEQLAVIDERIRQDNIFRESQISSLDENIRNCLLYTSYMKNGFIPVGVKPNYYHDGSDAIYMQRHM